MAKFDEIGNHKTVVFTSDGYTKVKYHQTNVVKFNEKEIILDSGRWCTPTTKKRMNQASNQFDLGYQVYQKDFEWFVVLEKDGSLDWENPLDFFDGITLPRKN